MSILDTAVLLAAGALIILAAYSVYHLLIIGAAGTKNLTVVALLTALEPEAAKAWSFGNWLALTALSDFQVKLAAVDRKAVADKMYDLLPDTIQVRGFPVPISLVKKMVSRAMFETLVDDAYNAAQAQFMVVKGILLAQVPALSANPVSKAPVPPAPLS